MADQRPLTILQMLPEMDAGGVEQGTLDLAAHLAGRGHRALVMSAPGRMVEALTRAGGEHIPWPVGVKSLKTLRWIGPLRRLLVEEKVDILHLRSRVPAWVGWLAWRGMDPMSRPRLVTTVHGFYSVNWRSAIMTRGERVVAVSQSIAGYIRQSYPPVEERRIRVIHRGVDPARFPYGYRPDAPWYDALYARYPQLRGKRLLTLAGRLTRLKGHDAFIRLLAALKARGHDDLMGLIVGAEDPRRGDYAREIRNLAQSSAAPILFTGHRSDMQELLAASDLIFSLSSKPESFGRAALEALMLGRPVIGYDHGGVGEILKAHYPEGRVALGDEKGLLERVEGWLRNPFLPVEQVCFPLQSMLDETLALYCELIE